MTQNLGIGLNVSDFLQGAAQFQAGLAKSGVAAEDFVLKLQKQNAAGKVVEQVFVGMDKAGRQFEATLRGVRDEQGKLTGAMRLTAIVAKNNTDELKKLAAAHKAVADAAAKQKAAGVAQQFVASNFSPTGTNQRSVTSAQSALAGAIARAGLTQAEVQAIFDRIKQGFNDIEVGARGRVQSALQALKKAFEDVEKAQQKVTDKAKQQQDLVSASQQVRSLFPVPPNATIDQLSKYEATIRRILALVKNGTITPGDLSAVLNKSVPINQLTPGQVQAQKLINNLTGAFKELGDTGEKSGQKVTITWQGVFRLFQAQVLHRAISSLISGFQAAISEAAQFSLKIGEIRTISQKNDLSTQQWSSSLRELSDRFALPLLDVTEAAYQAISNQIAKGADVSRFLADSLTFARVSVSSATDSVNLLSSAIQAYNLNSTDAERVSAIFFKTIELGRLRTSDIANSFGRVATLGHSLGISLEEASAALATITIQGVRPSEAITLLTNVMNHLLKPTDDMKELFNEWGVASGSAAIATFGFTGVLEKLDAELQKKGVSRLGDLEKDIRAIKGSLSLTGGNLTKFKDNLAEVTNGFDEFKKAQDRITETPGFKFQQAQEQLKNVFTVDLAQTSLTAFAKLADTLGGVTSLVSKFTEGLKFAAIGLGAYGIATLVASQAVKKLIVDLATSTAAFATQTVAIARGTTALSANALASRAWGTVFSQAGAQIILTAGLITAAYIAIGHAQAEAQIGQSENNIPQAIRRQQEDSLKEVNRGLEAQERRFKSSFDERFQVLLGFVAKTRSALFEQDQAFRRVDDRIENGLKKGFEDVFAKVKKDIESTQRILEEAKTAITASEKISRDIVFSETKTNFERQLQFLPTAGQRLGLEFGRQFASSSKDQLSASLDFASALKIESIKLFDSGNIEDARKKLEEINAILTPLLERQIAFRQKAAKLGVTFTTPLFGGGSDIDSRLKQNTQDRLGLEEQFKKVQTDRFRTAAASEQQLLKIQAEALKLEQARLEIAKQFSAAIAARKQANQDFTTSFTSVQGTLQDLDKFRNQFDQLTKELSTDFSNLFQDPTGQGRSTFESKQARQKALTDAAQAFKDLDAARVAFGSNANRSQADILAFQSAADKAAKSLQNLSFEFGEGLNPKRNGIQLNDLLKDLNGQFNKLGEANSQLNRGTQAQQLIESQLSNIDQLTQKLTTVNTIGSQAFGSQIDKITDLNKELDEIIKKLNKLSESPPVLRVPGIPGNPNTVNPIRGLDIPAFDTGGFVGGRAGIDTNLARVTRGESIISAENTAKFFPQVKAIMAGFNPAFTSGSNSVNVGDINVTVQGASSGAATGREIAQALRREIRRGSIRL